MAYQVYDAVARRKLLWRLFWRGLLWLVLAAIAFVVVALAVLVVQSRRDFERSLKADPVALIYPALEYALLDHIRAGGIRPETWAGVQALGIEETASRQSLHGHQPVNPFSGTPIRAVEPGRPFRPGDVVYIPALVTITENHQVKGTEPTGFYLLVIGPQSKYIMQKEWVVDFNLDGKRDELAYCGGDWQWEGGKSSKPDDGNYRSVESLESALRAPRA